MVWYGMVWFVMLPQYGVLETIFAQVGVKGKGWGFCTRRKEGLRSSLERERAWTPGAIGGLGGKLRRVGCFDTANPDCR